MRPIVEDPLTGEDIPEVEQEISGYGYPTQESEAKQESKLPAELEPEWPLGKLYDAFRAVSDLQQGCKKLPFSVAWKIDDLLELFRPYATKFERRQQELLAAYGKQVQNENLQPGEVSYQLTDPEGYTKHSRELSLSIPKDFNTEKLTVISAKELQKAKDLEVSIETIRVLRYLGLVGD